MVLVVVGGEEVCGGGDSGDVGIGGRVGDVVSGGDSLGDGGGDHVMMMTMVTMTIMRLWRW